MPIRGFYTRLSYAISALRLARCGYRLLCTGERRTDLHRIQLCFVGNWPISFRIFSVPVSIGLLISDCVRVEIVGPLESSHALCSRLVLHSDSLYHRLFSHPRMVEELVREFVPEALAAGLDFSVVQR